MRENLFTTYTLTGVELAVLISSRSERQVRCFPFVDGLEGEEEYLYALKSLSDKGIIIREGDGFAVTQPYERMISCIVGSELTVTLRTADDMFSDYCVYSAEEGYMLVLAMSPRRKGSVQLTYLEKDIFFDKFLPEEYLPVPFDYSFEQEEDSGFCYAMLDMLRHGEYINDVRFLLGVDIFNKRTGAKNSLIAAHMPMGIQLLSFEDEVYIAEEYSKARFTEQFFNILQGAQ